jgi:HEPN domain-containing protein
MKIDEPETYYRASLERIRQASILYREEESYALAIYLAGVAVECMLRAFKMRKDPTFDERHDLRRLFRVSGMMEIRPESLKSSGLSEDQVNRYLRELQASLSEIYSLWRNDFRFASEKRLRAHLKHLRLERGVRGDFLKANAGKLLSAAQTFINKGVMQWTSSTK